MDSPGDRIKRLLFACGCLLVVGIPLVCLFTFLLGIGAIGFVHDEVPRQEYVRVAIKLLGGVVRNHYTLSEDAEKKIAELGFDPSMVAYEILANKWINSKEGNNIDMGMDLAILESESAGGFKMGTCSAIASARAFDVSRRSRGFPSYEEANVKWLLELWKQNDVREWSEAAREMIKEDYSDYTAGCAAAEIGPDQFLPSTAVKVCKDGLSQEEDPLIKSCNLFDYRVAPYGKNWWLVAIEYRADLTRDQKFDELVGWNHDSKYRWHLIDRSEELNALISDWDFTPTPSDVFGFDTGDWGVYIVKALIALELLPKEVAWFLDSGGKDANPPVAVGDFANPYPRGKICGNAYGKKYANGTHWGIDMCIGTYPWETDWIYAMHGGKVVFARYLSRSEWIAGQWWVSGYTVAIEGEDSNGKKIWSCYGHGSAGTMKVNVGDTVEAGDPLMISGNTGYSDGNHLHLCMKVNNQWVNPSPYIPWGTQTGD